MVEFLCFEEVNNYRSVSYTHLDVYKRQGIGSSYFDTTFTGSNELISRTSSLKSAFENFDLFTLLYRLQMEDFFMKEMENLSWRYLALFPSSRSVQDYFTEWILHTLRKDKHWFDKLYSIFHMSLGRLFQSYYRDVSVLLELNGLKKSSEKEIKGEEEESICLLYTSRCV